MLNRSRPESGSFVSLFCELSLAHSPSAFTAHIALICCEKNRAAAPKAEATTTTAAEATATAVTAAVQAPAKSTILVHTNTHKNARADAMLRLSLILAAILVDRAHSRRDIHTEARARASVYILNSYQQPDQHCREFVHCDPISSSVAARSRACVSAYARILCKCMWCAFAVGYRRRASAFAYACMYVCMLFGAAGLRLSRSYMKKIYTNAVCASPQYKLPDTRFSYVCGALVQT